MRKHLSKSIEGRKLKLLVDQHFHQYISNENYPILHVKSPSLITSNRLDLAFKIFYLKMQKKNEIDFVKDLYVRHIKAFTLGNFIEPGNEDKKNSVDRYLKEFHQIHESITLNGLDVSRSVVPFSRGNTISNGAHRVAAAFVAEEEVPAVQLDVQDDQYDYKFFLERGMGQADIEIAVTKFIEYADNCYIALLWPAAKGRQADIDSYIPNLIYQREVTLNHNGAHNLLSQVYFNEEWLGLKEENFPGVKNKLVECFNNSGSLRVVAFQESRFENVLKIKNDVRDMFSIGKHSIHITDTKEEAIRVAKILFNQNSVHFLNHGQPHKYLSTFSQLERFKSFLIENDLNLDDVVIDGSVVMSLYGIREAGDVDYLSSIEMEHLNDGVVDNHEDELVFHHQSKEQLIYDQNFYFHFDDLKFISFHQLYQMKTNRSESKDNNDLVMMKALLEHSSFRMFMGRLRQTLYYAKAKGIMYTIKLLRVTKLYAFVRYIYRKLR